MPREVRVLPHYAVRLVTVAVADKKHFDHSFEKPFITCRCLILCTVLCHKCFDLIRIFNDILRKDFAPVLSNQEIILDTDTDCFFIDV